MIKSGSTAPALSDNDVANLAKIKEAYSVPIVFFGRVLDQNGNPIDTATVHYSVEDKYFGDGSKYESVSDANGLFEIRGVRGAAIWVNVAKSGYDGTDRSGSSFGYGVPSGNRPPSKDAPAIFVLRRKAAAEPLFKMSSRQFEIPKSGEPVGVDLKSRKAVRSESAQIQVESWVNDTEKNERRRFDWECRISVPGGGLVTRPADAFEAPEDGFRQSDVFKISKQQEPWSDRVERDYFVKLPDQTYARLRFEMMAGGPHNFFVIESYLNPSGSRNLEYDPAKEIKTH